MLLEASQLALWIMMTIQTMLLVVLLKQTKKQMGIAPGLRIPNMEMQQIKGNISTFEKEITDSPATMFCVISPNCKFCREIVPELNKLQLQNENFSIKLLAVGEIELIEEYIQMEKIIIPTFVISNEVLRKKLKISSFPFGIMVDNEGIVMRREIVKKDNILTWLIDIPNFTSSLSKERGVV